MEGGREGGRTRQRDRVPVVITSLHFHAKLSGCAERGNQQVVHRWRPGGRAGERLLHVTVPKFMVSLAIGRNTYSNASLRVDAKSAGPSVPGLICV